MERLISTHERKTSESVRKLMNAEIKPWQVYTYFNVYMVKIIFFGCGIMSLTEDEHNELQRIHETLTL